MKSKATKGPTSIIVEERVERAKEVIFRERVIPTRDVKRVHRENFTDWYVNPGVGTSSEITMIYLFSDDVVYTKESVASVNAKINGASGKMFSLAAINHGLTLVYLDPLKIESIGWCYISELPSQFATAELREKLAAESDHVTRIRTDSGDVLYVNHSHSDLAAEWMEAKGLVFENDVAEVS